MKQSEIDKLNIQKPEGIFTPNYSFSDITSIKNEDGEVIDYEYTDFILNKTAEEVYQQWLVDKDKPTAPKTTEVELLKQELITTQEAFDFLIMNGGI